MTLLVAIDASTCPRCATPLEAGDLRCAVCALPAPTTPAADAVPAVARAHVLRCTGCGAALAYDARHAHPACAFCRAVLRVEEPEDPIEIARLRVPFAVDRERATEALRGWLGQRRYFRPPSLRDEAAVESVEPLCWAAWIVHADVRVAWALDSDAGARRSTWAPHAGELRMELGGFAVPATRGLTGDECSTLVPFYDLGRAVSAGSPALDGEPDAIVESFDVHRSAARAHVQRAIIGAAKTRAERAAPGRRFRNVHVACLVERQTTERVALPAWVLAYRYRGAAYRAIVHGQSAEIVTGSLPLDWRKVGLVAGIALAIVAVVIAIALAAS